jgi:cellulose synthase operon protein C
VLGLIYVRTGRATQALDMLGPALRRAPDDPILLRTAGEAYVASGNMALAEKSYERANSLDKGNINSKIRLAQVRLASGDTERAFNDLQTLAAGDSSQYQAELALFNAHLRRREYADAMAAADALEKKQPKSGLPSTLRGYVHLAQRDLAGARASFEKALEMQPGDYSAASNLAVLDIREGKLQAARERYDRMLAKDPRNEQLLLASAEMLAIAGASAEQVKAELDKAIAANPSSVRARLALVNFHARRHDGKAALAAAQSGLSALPNDPQLTQALASSQLAVGDKNQAVDTLRRLVELQPQNPSALLHLAEAQVAVKDYSAAIVSERKALALKPDLAAAWTALAKTYLASGKPEPAIAEARKVQKEKPDKSFGFALEGEILASQHKNVEAANAFREAYKREQLPVLAARLYVALQRADKESDAKAVGIKWMKDHPKDATIQMIIAQQAQQRQDLTAAVAGYRQVLEIAPDNVVALNNLAWILSEQKDPKALEYAERAHQIAPFSPNVIDTLGWAMTRGGDLKRGIELLRLAVNLAPANGGARLHLAQALADSGDKAGARKELAELTKLDEKSPVRQAAEKLLATL